MNPVSKILAITLLLLMPALMLPCAHAAVYGGVELEYGHYEADEGGQQVADADSFAQRYSLVYGQRGKFMNGRGGEYTVQLGGEWTALATDLTINSVQSEVDITTSKVLYEGDILFAPGGLPFRIHLYSRDLNKTFFEYDRVPFSDSRFDNLFISEPAASVLTPNIAMDVSNGIHVETGISLALGIRNGSYLGKYREVLAHFPKLFVDYRESYVKDFESLTPLHYKDKEVAFVSLNKKHNWIHYRFYDHEDELNSLNDENLTRVIIGNIDQYLKREWVNLTNWIKISADGSHYREVNPLSGAGFVEGDELHFFVQTSRPKWKSALSSELRREESPNALKREALVPFFMHGDLDRDASWRFRFIGNAEKENRPFSTVNQETVDNNAFAETRFKLNKTGPYIVSPFAMVESSNGNFDGDGAAFEAGFELESNKDHFQDKAVRGAVSFLYLEEDLPLPAVAPGDYWELEGEYDYSTMISARSRVGVDSRLVYGDGQIVGSAMDYIAPVETTDLNKSNNAAPYRISESVTRVELAVFADHLSVKRVKNRAELSTVYLELDGNNYSQVFLEHSLDYSLARKHFSMDNVLYTGDNLDATRGVGGNTGSSLNASIFSGVGLTSLSKLQYQPNRNWSTSVSFEFDWFDDKDTSLGGLGFSLNQEVHYTKFSRVGRYRKLYDLSQFFEYSFSDYELMANEDVWLVALLGNYYPTSWSRLGAKVRVQSDQETGSADSGYGLYADLNFSKLTASLEYEYGMRTEDNTGTVLDRDEQRWQITIKKTF